MNQRFVTGQIIFNEGDYSDVAYMIMSGKVEIFRESNGGIRQHIAVLVAGQMFGELGILDNAPRNAGARALSDTVLRTIIIERE